MINNRTGSPFLKLAFFTALFFLSLVSPWAQNRRYVTEQRFIHRLVWVGDEYAFRYEVVIEQEEGKEYREFKREFTASSSLVISLPLGKYRYHIIPYDFLDQPGEASDWITLNVAAPTTSETPGQSASSGPEKQVDFFLSAAWAPSFPVYGRIQQIFGYEFYASGAAIRVGMLYNKPQWFSPGIEFSTSWYALNKTLDNDTFGIQTGATGFNIVARKQIPGPKMAVTLRAGGALAFQIGDLDTEEYSHSMGGLSSQLNMEASFLWFAYKKLYLEGGLGFSFLINKNGDSGYLHPCFGAGWQF